MENLTSYPQAHEGLFNYVSGSYKVWVYTIIAVEITFVTLAYKSVWENKSFFTWTTISTYILQESIQYAYKDKRPRLEECLILENISLQGATLFLFHSVDYIFK